MPKIAVLVPCYKRPEYTKLCLDHILTAQSYSSDIEFIVVNDGSGIETHKVLSQYPFKFINLEENVGLRNIIIDFFEWVLSQGNKFDYITKIDSDCLVPENWLNDLTCIFENANADIISPNVSESNAAHKYGRLNKREGDFIPSEIVGGLWFMKREMIEGLFFEKFKVRGIRAAFHLINQIVAEKNPKIGWTDAVTYEDVGYLKGTHPLHIKSSEHANYSAEVGREIKWVPKQKQGV